MTSVIRTKTPKIEMLTTGLPIVSASAANRSTTGGLLTAVGGGELVRLEALAHLVGDRVGAAGRVPHVERGDQERRHELPEAEQDPDVDVADDLGGHEVVRVAGEQHVEQVPGQEGHRHRDGEAAEPAAEFGELR